MEDNRPFIIRNLLNPSTLQREPRTIYFDAVYPVIYADGIRSARGEGVTRNGEASAMTSAEYFIIRQLWPKHCAPSRELAEQIIHPTQQQELFICS